MLARGARARDAGSMRTEAKIWALILVATAGLGGFGAWRQLSAPAPMLPSASSEMDFVGKERNAQVPTRAELADLQAKADNACLCARTSSNLVDCWADYHQSIARFDQSNRWVAMCGEEESPATDCFGPEGANQLCVITRRINGTCTDAEQRTRLAEAHRRNPNSC
jgi:hypothetical protein